jgi:hypothetical protein
VPGTSIGQLLKGKRPINLFRIKLRILVRDCSKGLNKVILNKKEKLSLMNGLANIKLKIKDHRVLKGVYLVNYNYDY